ncbi:MAG: AgmX/PglI C-terminal domain-containing protein, partial [Myxococcales bacterium]|nr:AgmX/PglI C-terminal domain-containing protein [Myxococcales bacterium]
VAPVRPPTRPVTPPMRPVRPPPPPPKPKQNEPAKLTLSRDDILAVINANQSKVQGCVGKAPELAGSLVSVAVVINRNGSVGSARVATAKARGTEAAPCLEAVVKGMAFPAFTSDPIRTTLPLKL